MKQAMYAIIALLSIMVGILVYMNANKPHRMPEDVALADETKMSEREILFNLTPPPDPDEITYLPIDPYNDEDEDEEADPDITKLDKKMYAISAVNLRSGPSTDFERVGSLSANQEVHVIGQSSRTGWYKIVHDDGAVFVSASYLEERAASNADAVNDEPIPDQPDVYEPNPEDF